MSATKFKIALKLEKKDEDLNLLFKRHMAKKVIIDVIKAQINGNRVRLPLPPFQKDIPLKQYYRYTYLIAGNEDVIEWLNTIEPGYKNHALKTIIRHAMEKPDIRHYEKGNAEKSVKPLKEPKPERKTVPNVPAQEQREPDIAVKDTIKPPDEPPANIQIEEKTVVPIKVERPVITQTVPSIAEQDNQPKGINKQMSDLLDMLE